MHSHWDHFKKYPWRKILLSKPNLDNHKTLLQIFSDFNVSCQTTNDSREGRQDSRVATNHLYSCSISLKENQALGELYPLSSLFEMWFEKKTFSSYLEAFRVFFTAQMDWCTNYCFWGSGNEDVSKPPVTCFFLLSSDLFFMYIVIHSLLVLFIFHMLFTITYQAKLEVRLKEMEWWKEMSTNRPLCSFVKLQETYWLPN